MFNIHRPILDHTTTLIVMWAWEYFCPVAHLDMPHRITNQKQLLVKLEFFCVLARRAMAKF
jgi:hypothetical protein